MTGPRISVLLSDDNLIIREGVRSLLTREPDLDVVGVAGDYDELLAEAERTQPQVVVTDIRMPPTFQREGIDAAKEIRRRDPGVGVVILFSVLHCLPVVMVGENAAGTGTVMREDTVRGYAEQAGFADLDVAPIENDFWRFYLLTP